MSAFIYLLIFYIFLFSETIYKKNNKTDFQFNIDRFNRFKIVRKNFFYKFKKKYLYSYGLNPFNISVSISSDIIRFGKKYFIVKKLQDPKKFVKIDYKNVDQEIIQRYISPYIFCNNKYNNELSEFSKEIQFCLNNPSNDNIHKLRMIWIEMGK